MLGMIFGGTGLGIRWQSPDASSLTLSWQTLAAMATVSSLVVAVAVAYLKASWGKDLTTATVTIGDRVRSEIKDAVTPLERRIERLEDRPTPSPYREQPPT